ncbi:alpha-L-arabinofuranosidase C-terminal domain-containing protein, partial [Oenococcus oeni]
LQNIPQPESSLDHRLDRIDLVVGEWGNWHRTAFTAKPALKQQVTMRDAISTALMLDILQKNSDKVTMACVAQTINVLNALILTEGDQTILTPNYDVFMMYKAHRGNSALKIQTNQDQKNVYTFASKKDGEIILDVINANLNDQVKLTVELNREIESISKDFLQSDRPTDFNSSDNPDLIRMQQT